MMKDKESHNSSSQAVNLEESVSIEVIRPELNIEKWPAIWQPAQSRIKPKEKFMERSITLTNGNKVTATIEVGFTNKGVLTTEDQKVWYALVRLWEAGGRNKRIFFSRNKIAKSLNKQWGTKTANALTDSFFRLRFTPITWTNAFFDKSSGKTIEKVKTLTLLSDYKIATEKKDGHVTNESCYCEFHQLIFNNLIHNYVKPTLFDTVISFDDGMAQILYNHLDLILSEIEDKVYKRRTEGLFQDFYWDTKEYKYVSARKRTLLRIIPKLQGKELSKEGQLNLKLEKTVDNKDFNLVAERQTFTAIENNQSNYEQAQTITKTVSNKEVHQTKLDKERPTNISHDPERELAPLDWNELIQYFYWLFHSCSKEFPSQKEIKLARRWINIYGLNIAKLIVDYALNMSKKSNYLPHTLLGIEHFEPQAVAKSKSIPSNGNSSQKQLAKSDPIKNIPKDTLPEIYQKAIQNIKEAFPNLALESSDELIKEEMVRIIENPLLLPQKTKDK